MAPALVLFDIDGTLLRRAGPHHREALVEAVRIVARLNATVDHIPTQGMLDGDIFARMLRESGVSEGKIRQLMPHLMRRAQWIYARRCPVDLSEKVCPGVVPFLQALRTTGVLAGLVSGNLTQIAWKKMERAGLKAFFRFGAFADHGRTRSELVRIAIRQARSQGWIRKATPVTLIGDHPNDINAAKENRVRAVGVATGISTRDELAAHAPDILVDDLCALNLERLLQ